METLNEWFALFLSSVGLLKILIIFLYPVHQSAKKRYQWNASFDHWIYLYILENKESKWKETWDHMIESKVLLHMDM